MIGVYDSGFGGLTVLRALMAVLPTHDFVYLGDSGRAPYGGRDVDTVLGLMTDDVVFDNTRPAPDGERVAGQAAVRAVWEALFQRSPQARFEAEEVFAAGERGVVRWVYHWVRDGVPGHVRGVDVFRVRAGRVAEKLSYVKG